METDAQNVELVLSADFELKEARSLLGPATLKAYPDLEEQFALVDTYLDSTYLINASIYNFLTLFSEPTPLDKVLAELATDAASRRQVTTFVTELRKREILVTQEQNTALLALIAKDQELPPVAIDPARVLKVLRHTGQIWIGLVRDEARPDPYVLKKLLLPPSLSERERAKRIEEFSHEVAMHQAAGGHPNIVALYGADEKEHEMRLQYVEGVAIRNFVKTGNPPLGERYRLIAKILDVFVHLHANGVLHGDIHSSNFLVTAEKEPMLLDFGMARRVGKNCATRGRIGGVYPYAPPERISTRPMEIFNRKQTSRTAEVYQLGIIFYLILYHELPFDGATWKNLAGSILGLAPVWKPQTPAGEDIPAEVIKVLQKALEKKPADRYASMRDFASAWEQASESLSAGPCN